MRMTGSDVKTMMGGFVDRARWRWWDRVIARHGKLELPFFRVPVMAVCPFSGKVKTFRETNMIQGDQIPAPMHSVVFQVGFEVAAPTPIIDLFYGSCWMEFKVWQKVFLRGPLWRFREGDGYQPETLKHDLPDPTTVPEEFRPLYQSTLDELESTSILFEDRKAYPGPQAGYRLNESARYLPPLTPFGVKLYFSEGIPASCDGIEVCAYLDCLTDLPVQ